jgi:RNA polymerase sigma-70 factor (ECF subfamily)
VWRLLRRLGVALSNLDDAVQDVFIVVHQRRAAVDGRASLRAWIAGIAVGVAANARRRQDTHAYEPLVDVTSDESPGPHEHTLRLEAREILDRLLRQLDDDQREVLVLVEHEGLSAPEVAQALGANVNTVYSRLRLARRHFEELLRTYQAGVR